MLADGAIVFLATTLSGAMGVLYTFAMARLLDTTQYAALVSLLSILGLASLPASTLQTVVARFVAMAGAGADGQTNTTGVVPARGDRAGAGAQLRASTAQAIVNGVLRRIVPLAIAVTAVVALSSPWLARFLRLEGPLPALVLAPTLGLALLVPLLRGAAQGLHAFGVLAGLLLLESLFKVAGGALLAWAGFGAAGVLGALLAGAAVCTALGWLWFVRLAPRWASAVTPQVGTAAPPTHANAAAPTSGATVAAGPAMVPGATSAATGLGALWRFSIPALLANGGIFAMVVLDTVLVQHYFDAPTAAAFAALSVTGRSLYWATGAITLVLLPIVARQTARVDPAGQSAGRWSLPFLWWGLAIAAALVTVGEVAFLLAPELILRLLFGGAYLGAAPLLPLYGAGTAALSLANVVLYYLLGCGRAIAGPIAALCALAQLTAIVLWHADLTQVVTTLVATDVALLVLTLLSALRDRPAGAA